MVSVGTGGHNRKRLLGEVGGEEADAERMDYHTNYAGPPRSSSRSSS